MLKNNMAKKNLKSHPPTVLLFAWDDASVCKGYRKAVQGMVTLGCRCRTWSGAWSTLLVSWLSSISGEGVKEIERSRSEGRGSCARGWWVSCSIGWIGGKCWLDGLSLWLVQCDGLSSRWVLRDGLFSLLCWGDGLFSLLCWGDGLSLWLRVGLDSWRVLRDGLSSLRRSCVLLTVGLAWWFVLPVVLG